MKFALLLFFLIYSSCSYCQNIVFVNPSVPGVSFWDRVTKITHSAARDLDIELEVVYGADNRISHFETLTKVASRQEKPSLVVFMPYGGNAKFAYQLFENAKIPFITMERTLEDREAQGIGTPGETFKYWVGEVFHDNQLAGKQLAESIIQESYQLFGKKELSLAALTGSFSGESSHRNDGLMSAIASHSSVSLLQIVPAHWSRERGKNAIHKLINRHKKVELVWCASDSMALGVLDSLKALNNDSLNRTVIGGFDWTREAIDEIKKGNLHASIGGHIFQGAWTMVLAKDVLSDEVPKYLSVDYDLELINKYNINRYHMLATDFNWDVIDFKEFSIKNAENTAEYSFSFNRILSLLEK